MLDTTMSRAFSAAGLSSSENKFRATVFMAYKEFIKGGGTYARASELIDQAATKLRSEASLYLPQGQVTRAETPQHHSTRPAFCSVPQGQGVGAEPSRTSNPRGAAHVDVLQKGRSSAAAPPRVSPAVSQRVAAEAAASVFDTFVVAGSRIGNIRYNELDHYLSKGRKEIDLLAKIKRHGKPSQVDVRLRYFISEPVLKRLIKECGL